MNIQPKTHVEANTDVKVTYERRSALFGLIRWWEEVKVERLGSLIHIETDHTIDEVFINGNSVYQAK